MPTAYSETCFRCGTKAEYDSIDAKDQNSIYFTNDTHQIFVGDSEYSSTASTITKDPAQSDKGEEGRFYVNTVNGSLHAYVGGRWLTVYDPVSQGGTVLREGEGITCTPNPITATGSISHKVPEGAKAITVSDDSVTLNLGDSVDVQQVCTDKFGHVTAVKTKKIKMSDASALSGVLKFKGTKDNASQLPSSGNIVGDVYYIIESSAEYVYLEKGWELLGPIVDSAGLIPRVKNAGGYLPVINDDGTLSSSGIKAASSATPGSYGTYDDTGFSIPSITIDDGGRVTSASSKKVSIASKEYVSDMVAYIMEEYMRY